jgi:hypothetical protein
MKIIYPIVFILLIYVFIAYILKRDSAVDDGAKPFSVEVGKYTLTPSRWAWRQIRENKAAAAGFIAISVLSLWAWLT